MFQRGDKNDIWGLNFIKYGINSGKVQGKGHSTYRTDIWKNEYNLCNASFSKNTEKEIVSNDNIRIFSRIEWETNNVNVIMNIEYWYLEKDELVGYIPYSKLPVKIQNKSCENRKRIWKYLEDKYISEYEFRIPSKKKNSLHMCINEINETQNQSMKQVIDSIKIILKKLEEYENYIASNIIIGEDGLLTFNYD